MYQKPSLVVFSLQNYAQNHVYCLTVPQARCPSP